MATIGDDWRRHTGNERHKGRDGSEVGCPRGQTCVRPRCRYFRMGLSTPSPLNGYAGLARISPRESATRLAGEATTTTTDRPWTRKSAELLGTHKVGTAPMRA